MINRVCRHAGLVALVGLSLPLAAGAQPTSESEGNSGQRCFNGYAYTLDGGDYRYTEHHEITRQGETITDWNVTYVGRDGDVLATKHMDFSDNPTVPVYEMKMPGSGYLEGISHQDDTWTMYKRENADAKRQSKNFTIDPPMAADSGFNQLVANRFDALQSGKTVKFGFAAAGRQSVIDLKASKTGTTTFEDKPAVVFTAKLDMFLVNHLVQSLKLTYDPDTKHLLQYEGIGNIPNEAGEVYPVRVSYYDQMPDVARDNGAPKAACGSVSAS